MTTRYLSYLPPTLHNSVATSPCRLSALVDAVAGFGCTLIVFIACSNWNTNIFLQLQIHRTSNSTTCYTHQHAHIAKIITFPSVSSESMPVLKPETRSDFFFLRKSSILCSHSVSSISGALPVPVVFLVFFVNIFDLMSCHLLHTFSQGLFTEPTLNNK